MNKYLVGIDHLEIRESEIAIIADSKENYGYPLYDEYVNPRYSEKEIDWTKFKGKKGATYESSKKSYINLINALSKIDFKLNNDYIRNSVPIQIIKNKLKITATPVAILKKVESYFNFLEVAKSENDEVIGINGLSPRQEFIIDIKPLNSINNITLKFTILHYYRHIESRRKFYLLLNKNNHKIKSDYLCTTKKILIDFNCKHSPYPLTPQAYSHTPHCTYCSGSKVVKGFNDIATTNPASVIFFKDKTDAENFSFGSEVKTYFECPDCGTETFRKIAGVVKKGLRCKRCYDGLSFPQKFMNNLLFQLVELGQLSDFITEYKPIWRDGKSYDNYFTLKDNKYIIENHGLQHYADTSRGRSYLQEKENDNIKKELALDNKISEENYIVIDCRYSNIEYIKNSIFSSELSQIFELKDIDWLHCFELSLKNLVKIVCEMWHTGNYSTTDIHNKLKLGKTTIRRYLRHGEKLDWCVYNSELEILKCQKLASKARSKPIICLNNKHHFSSIREASKIYHISEGSIAQCCNGIVTYAGVDKSTGEKLVWITQEKYSLMSNSDISTRLSQVHTPFKGANHPYSKEVIILDCNNLNILGIFPTAQFASETYCLSFKNISACCRGTNKICGRLPSNIALLSLFSVDWEEIKLLNYSLAEIRDWKLKKYSKNKLR